MEDILQGGVEVPKGEDWTQEWELLQGDNEVMEKPGTGNHFWKEFVLLGCVWGKRVNGQT